MKLFLPFEYILHTAIAANRETTLFYGVVYNGMIIVTLNFSVMHYGNAFFFGNNIAILCV